MKKQIENNFDKNFRYLYEPQLLLDGLLQLQNVYTIYHKTQVVFMQLIYLKLDSSF